MKREECLQFYHWRKKTWCKVHCPTGDLAAVKQSKGAYKSIDKAGWLKTVWYNVRYLLA